MRIMRIEGRKNTTTYRTLLRGVSWFTSFVALAILLTACGGGNGGNQPPPPSAASLAGLVTFTVQVPLTTPPGDAFDGPVPPKVRYGARIIDPGDDIGGVPIPKPGKLAETGEYEFTNLVTDAMSYLNLRFTVDAPLEQNGFPSTPVGFNVPIALLEGFSALLSVNIDKPSDTVLQMTYTYRGPDGSRIARLQVDFVSDLITFDLDSDGLFDDIIGVDYNHDAIPDTQAPVIEQIDYTDTEEIVGPVTSVTANLIGLSGDLFTVWGSTNVMNKITGDPLTLSDITVGNSVTIDYVIFSGGKLATSVKIQPNPVGPSSIQVFRDGAIEEIIGSSLVVGGILFQNYTSAVIEDVLGNKVLASTLAVGDFVRVTGERTGSTIVARKIIVQTVEEPPNYIERTGTIQALSPEGSPTLMTVAGLTFQIGPTTVIRDMDDVIVSADYLEVNDPVWVFGREDAGVFYADLIELQFVISEEEINPEIMIIIDDASALGEFTSAIDGIETELAITPIVVSTWPVTVSDPPCVEDAFYGLNSSAGNILKMQPGYIESYPRVDGADCVVLNLVDDGFKDYLPWYNWLYPDGINGVPFEYDLVSKDKKFGAPPEMIEALEIADQLSIMFEDHPHLVYVYVSPDIGFWTGD